MEKILLAWWAQHRRLTLTLGGGLVGLLSLGLLVTLWGHQPAPVADPALASSAVATRQSSAMGQSGQSVSSAPSRSSSVATSSASGPMYVDVKGAVNHPGVYAVNEQMRVADVVALAKGLRAKADREQVNLAEKVTDQQVIYVPVKGEKMPVTRATKPAATSTTGASSSSATAESGAPINLNIANVTELQQLAGIGQKKAEKIIEYRETHDGFKTVDDLKQVAGIGDKTLEKFRNQLTV